MSFNSIDFFAFLLITLALFFITRQKWKWIILLLASLVFIYSFSLRFLIYTVIYAILNYITGIFVAKAPGARLKQFIYLTGIIINIGLLVFYKYTNFLLEILFGILNIAGVENKAPLLSLVIPLGISFYTFQSIGYLIDVYRGTRQVETNFGKFILFITYFPKFISGPVERTNTLLPELNKTVQWDSRLFNEGLLQTVWGFTKTIIVADRLEVIVNEVNSNIADLSGSVLWLNFFLQFIYLYFNFSGYTDTVLGISKLFGIRLINNFERPFFANNVSNYWRRWHISLTTWCNDYIFRRIILKRMKWKRWASVYGVFLTFFIIGIWHGANWNFVLLGILQGVAINYEFFTKKTRLEVGSKIPVWLNLFISRLMTLVFICFSHVLFFSRDIKQAFYYL